MIVKGVFDELIMLDPTLPAKTGFENCLIQYIEKQNDHKFIFILDEWDAIIREAKDDEIAQKRYLNLLRGWFKNSNFTPKAVAAAYMTGILPIKKDGSQSAISDFEEYSMIIIWPMIQRRKQSGFQMRRSVRNFNVRSMKLSMRRP